MKAKQQHPTPARKKGPQTILVPIDFSAASKRALAVAAATAADASRIILLHVIAPSDSNGRDRSRLLNAAQRRLNELARSNGAVAPSIMKAFVCIGTPFQEIIKCAEENSVELIVLGVHDSAGVALGHTADRVSRYARHPVLLVRETEPAAAGA